MANSVHSPSPSSPSESDVLIPEEPTLVVVTSDDNDGDNNKPKKKPAIREELLKPMILIVDAGMDIINTIIDFARTHDVTILVHHASGIISEVNLRNPLSTSNDLSFRGNLYMFFLSGFYTKSLSPSKDTPFSFFNIQFSNGRNSQLFGGLIGHTLIAAEPVSVVASIVNKHEYYEAEYPIITDPIVQPLQKSTTCANCYPSIVSVPGDDITNNINANHHLDFSVGDSPSSLMNPSAPIDSNIIYTNEGDNY